MGFDTSDVIQEAGKKLFTRQGMTLLSVALIFALLGLIGLDSALYDFYLDIWERAIENDPELADTLDHPDEMFPYAIDIPLAASVGVLLLSWLGYLVISIAALRWFYPASIQPLSFDLVSRNLGSAILNLIIGGILFAIAWLVGLLFFIIPGIFIFVVLIYYYTGITIEDRSFISAMSRSNEVTKGNRWQVFFLYLVVFVLAMVISPIGFTVQLIDPFIGQTVTVVLNSFIGLFFFGITAVSFRYLVEAQQPQIDVDDSDEFEPFTPVEA